MRKPLISRPVGIPLALLLYLAAMAYVGRGELQSGNYLYYFGVIGASLVCIILLHFSLKKRERLRRERLDDIARNNPDDTAGQRGNKK